MNTGRERNEEEERWVFFAWTDSLSEERLLRRKRDEIEGKKQSEQLTGAPMPECRQERKRKSRADMM